MRVSIRLPGCAGLPSSISSEKDSYGYSAIFKFPRLIGVEGDLAVARQGEEALLVRSVRPEGSIDFVWNDSRRYLMLDN